MLRFAQIRAFCFVLAFITVVGLWFPYPETVNDWMAMGTWIADHVAEFIAWARDKQLSYVKTILKSQMGFDSTIVFSVIALLYSGVFDWHNRFLHLLRTAAALLIAHVFIAFCWIENGDFTMWWYEGHAAWFNQVWKENQWHRLVTADKVFKLNHIFIFAEALAVATLVVRFFILGWRRYRRAATRPAGYPY